MPIRRPAVRLTALALVASTALATAGCIPGSSSSSSTPSPAASSPAGPTPEEWAASLCPAFADALLAPEAFGSVDENSSPDAARIGWQRAAEKSIDRYDTLLDVLEEPTPDLDEAPEVVGVMKSTFGALRARMVAIRDDAEALDTTDQAAFAAGAQKIVDSLSGAETDLNTLDELDRVDPDGTVSAVLEKNTDCSSLGG
ncbi:MAG: hypothetical protein ACRCZD_14030 [Phycicoccus sp.]